MSKVRECENCGVSFKSPSARFCSQLCRNITCFTARSTQEKELEKINSSNQKWLNRTKSTKRKCFEQWFEF